MSRARPLRAELGPGQVSKISEHVTVRLTPDLRGDVAWFREQLEAQGYPMTEAGAVRMLLRRALDAEIAALERVFGPNTTEHTEVLAAPARSRKARSS